MAIETPAIQRSTRQLALVLAAVQASGREHPTAEAVFARVRRVLPRISLGTVYRNLQRLAADGRIGIAHVGGRSARYDPTITPRDHCLCEQCGRNEYEATPTPGGSVRAAKRAGHQVRGHALVLFGRCRDCTRAA